MRSYIRNGQSTILSDVRFHSYRNPRSCLGYFEISDENPQIMVLSLFSGLLYSSQAFKPTHGTIALTSYVRMYISCHSLSHRARSPGPRSNALSITSYYKVHILDSRNSLMIKLYAVDLLAFSEFAWWTRRSHNLDANDRQASYRNL